jgi:hypothetical protein
MRLQMAMTPGTQESENAPTLTGRVLGLLASRSAYMPHQLALAPSPTRELWEIINAFDALPTLTVRCRECGRRLARWELDRETCLVKPVDRYSKAFEGKAAPFIEKANARRGAVTAGNTHDGLGTHNYLCKLCRLDVSLTAESRLRLYIGAIRNPRREVWV